VHTIEAAEVCVRESHSGTSLWLQGPTTGVPGGGAWLGTENCISSLLMPPPAASSGSDEGPIAARDPETRLNPS
jgi:hypothetical protein